MSAPSMPPDTSLQAEQQRIAAEERRRAEEAAAAEKRKQELAQLRTNAASAARTSAMDYFGSRGLQGEDYASNIDSKINSILAGMSPEEESPGSYFTDIGANVWTEAEQGARAKAGRDLDTLFAPNFEMSRIPYTLDDPYLQAIEAEHKAQADNYIRNLLDRGVITETGYNAAYADLDKQAPGVRSRLNEIGTTTLSGGQQKLRDISNEARQTAGSLALGTAFDPYSYSSRADQTYNDFIQSLGDTIRSQITGDLFSTAGLASIAGAGMGAQNTKFDPSALAGVESDEEEKDKSAATVF
jgi:hypothetical protein